MVSTSAAAQGLAAYLRSLLPATGKVLGVGWDRDDRPFVPDRLAEGCGDLWTSTVGDGLPAGPFDAVLWRLGPDLDDPSAAVALRRRLRDEGRLIAVVPAETPAPLRAGRRRGGLATKDQPDLRRLYRALSETGFAIRGERRFEQEGRIAVVAARDPFVVRSYREGDERAILELFPTCFHVERSLEHWRWKYLGNPYGALKISMSFAPGGELAAHYASYPMPFWIGGPEGGRSVLALQMGDTMTAPRFREEGRGRNALLPRTVRHFFASHRDGTFSFFYGFNTGPIQRFCQWFIGGSVIAPVSYWVRDLDREAFPAPPSERYRVRQARRVTGEWDRFFRRVAPRYRFLAERDARWVDWRYLSCPDADFVVLVASRWGRPAGWSVFRRRDDLLVWGDALFDPRHPGAADAVLSAAVRHPALLGARRLAAWFSPEPRWWSGRLPALGLRAEPEPDGLGMVALEDGEKGAIDRLRGLYYTMGDSDLF